MYTDAHTHLNADQLFPQRDTHLQNFIDLGGHALINIGVNDERNQRAIQIAQQAISRFPACIVKATLGMHPGEIAFGNISTEKQVDTTIDMLQRQLDAHAIHVVGIGESGIDAHYDRYEETKALQQYAFHRQALLARERNLPIIIHSRDQFMDTREVIQHYTDLKIYFHCRGYTPDDIRHLIEHIPQLRVGFCGNTTYSKAQHIRDSLHTLMTHTLPSEHTAQFVLETDAPYLSPQTKRGTMNVPAHIPDLYTAIAKELQVSVEKLQTMTREAMQALYTIS